MRRLIISLLSVALASSAYAESRAWTAAKEVLPENVMLVGGGTVSKIAGSALLPLLLDQVDPAWLDAIANEAHMVMDSAKSAIAAAKLTQEKLAEKQRTNKDGMVSSLTSSAIRADGNEVIFTASFAEKDLMKVMWAIAF